MKHSIVAAVTSYTQSAAIDARMLEREHLAYRAALFEQVLERRGEKRALETLQQLGRDAARDSEKIKSLVRADIARTP